MNLCCNKLCYLYSTISICVWVQESQWNSACTCGTEKKSRWNMCVTCSVFYIQVDIYFFLTYAKHFVKRLIATSKLNSPAAEMTTFLRVHYLAPNSPHYSWPYSRGHCHGVYFFFTSLNWKSRENESRHPHMEWAIGLTLTCPQTAKWKNSFIYVMWTVGDCAGGQYGCWCHKEYWLKYWDVVIFFFFLIFFSRVTQVVFPAWQVKCKITSLISMETSIPCASEWFPH